MARSRRGVPIHGWLVIDKPQGMTSAHAVAAVRRLTGAAKAGHAGTLDPLATGVLPVALGEATKTIAWAAAGRKLYRFRVRWGVATDTDDAEGRIVAENPARPDAARIRAALPRFAGTIMQRPPAYSALKLAGARAYDLAREGRAVALAPRPVEVARFELAGIPAADHADFTALVGKGTYVRALARDLAQALGTLGHVTVLRRLSVGGFGVDRAISLDNLAALGHSAAASEHLLPIETALDDIPAMALTEAEAKRLRCGQAVTPSCPSDRARIAHLDDGATVCATSQGRLVALVAVAAGALRPVRVMNI